MASPAGSTATSGSDAFWPAAERSSGDCQGPPAGLLALCTIVLVPLERDQTATTLPAESTASWGSDALWPPAERSAAASQAGAARTGAAGNPPRRQRNAGPARVRRPVLRAARAGGLISGSFA